MQVKAVFARIVLAEHPENTCLRYSTYNQSVNKICYF